jgi:hypothetical protein
VVLLQSSGFGTLLVGSVEAGPKAAVETNFTYRGIEKSRKMKFEQKTRCVVYIFFSNGIGTVAPLVEPRIVNNW